MLSWPPASLASTPSHPQGSSLLTSPGASTSHICPTGQPDRSDASTDAVRSARSHSLGGLPLPGPQADMARSRLEDGGKTAVNRVHPKPILCHPCHIVCTMQDQRCRFPLQSDLVARSEHVPVACCPSAGGGTRRQPTCPALPGTQGRMEWGQRLGPSRSSEGSQALCSSLMLAEGGRVRKSRTRQAGGSHPEHGWEEGLPDRERVGLHPWGIRPRIPQKPFHGGSRTKLHQKWFQGASNGASEDSVRPGFPLFIYKVPSGGAAGTKGLGWSQEHRGAVRPPSGTGPRRAGLLVAVFPDRQRSDGAVTG